MGNWVQVDEHGVVPGAVTIGTITASYLDSERVEVLIPYTAPVVAGATIGVHAWEESPDVSSLQQAPADGTVAMDGSRNSGGVWKPEDIGKYTVNPISRIISSKSVAFTVRYYLVAYSEVAENILVQANKPNATPSATITIQPQKYQSGVEYAWLVTGASAVPEYDDSQVASPKYRIRFRWTPPTDRPAVWMKEFGYCNIVYEYDLDSRRVQGLAMASGETDTLSGWYDLFVGTSIIRCWFVSSDNSNDPRINTIVPGLTPFVDVTVEWPLPSRPAPGRYADNVAGFAVTSGGYARGQDGQRVLQINWSWVKPVGPDALARWGGAVIYSYKPSKPSEIIARTGPELGTSGTMEFPDLPTVAETWTFRAISRDNNNNANTDQLAPVAGTPAATLAVTPAPVDVAPVTGFSVQQPYYDFNGQGVKSLLCVPTFTRPADRGWAYINFYATVAGSVDGGGVLLRYPLGSPIEGGVPGTAYIQDFPVVTEQWTFRAYSVDVNGRESLSFVSSGPFAVSPPPTNASAVVNFSVTQPYYDVPNGQGATTLLCVPHFDKPLNDPNWAYINFYVQIQPSPTLIYLGSPVVGEVGEAALIKNFPSVLQQWIFFAMSVDIYGKENANSLVRYPPAPTTFPVGPPGPSTAGIEWAAHVTGFAFTATTFTDSNGILMYKIEVTFTPPADPRWGGGELRLYNGATLVAQNSGSKSPTSLNFTSPASSASYTAKFVSQDVNGKTNTETGATPQAELVIGNNAGTLDMTKITAESGLDIYIGPSGKIEIRPDAVDTVEIKDDAIKSPKIFANAVIAEKIAANAVIAEKIMADAVTAVKILAGNITTAKLDTNGITVGGGSQMAGVVKVVDASSVLVAELGKLTVTVGQPPAHGGWFKVFGAGGTNYTTAKVFSDINGNLTVKDVTFTIKDTGTVSEIFTEPAMFDANYQSIVLTVRSTSLTGPRAWHLSKGFVCRMGQDWQTGSLNTMASFDRCGEMVLYQPSTMAGQTTLNRISIWANGSDGSIRAFAYNILKLNATNQQTEVYFGQSGNYTDPAGKTMVFQNGILIGKGGW